MLGTKLYVLRKQVSSTLGNLLRPANALLGKVGLSVNWLMMAVLIGLLVVMLCACSPRVVRPSLPPQAEPQQVPQFEGKTYRDVLLYVIELREACYASEADKAAIRYVYERPHGP